MTNSDILTLENQLREAMLASDVNALDRLIDDSLIFINPDGERLTKRQDLELHQTGELNFDKLQLDDFAVEYHGPIAVVAVRAHVGAHYRGNAVKGCYRFTRVWSLENGVCKVVAAHSSPIH